MELWELQAILDIELQKAEGQRDHRLIAELVEILGVEVLEEQEEKAADAFQ